MSLLAQLYIVRLPDLSFWNLFGLSHASGIAATFKDATIT
jgi:hypothetical protein